LGLRDPLGRGQAVGEVDLGSGSKVKRLHVRAGKRRRQWRGRWWIMPVKGLAGAIYSLQREGIGERRRR